MGEHICFETVFFYQQICFETVPENYVQKSWQGIKDSQHDKVKILKI